MLLVSYPKNITDKFSVVSSSLMFSSWSFTVLGLTVRSLIHFELIDGIR